MPLSCRCSHISMIVCLCLSLESFYRWRSWLFFSTSLSLSYRAGIRSASPSQTKWENTPWVSRCCLTWRVILSTLCNFTSDHCNKKILLKQWTWASITHFSIKRSSLSHGIFSLSPWVAFVKHMYARVSRVYVRLYILSFQSRCHVSVHVYWICSPHSVIVCETILICFVCLLEA